MLSAPQSSRAAVIGAYRSAGEELRALPARLGLARDVLAAREGFASYHDMVRTLAADRQADVPQAVVTLRTLGGDDHLIPEWSAVLADVRRDIGTARLSALLAQARGERIDERALRTRVDQALSDAPLPRVTPMSRFWDTAGGAPASDQAAADRAPHNSADGI